MNIVDKRVQQFSALKIGDTFIDDDGSLFLKIDGTDAIDLSKNGCKRRVLQGEIVTQVRCTITINS